jgi:hypothetical protein
MDRNLLVPIVRAGGAMKAKRVITFVFVATAAAAGSLPPPATPLR